MTDNDCNSANTSSDCAINWNKVFSAMRGFMNELSVQDMVKVAGKAGFDCTGIQSAGRRPEVFGELGKQFESKKPDEQGRILVIMVEECLKEISRKRKKSLKREDLLIPFRDTLQKLGYDYLNEKFICVGLLDEHERPYLPKDAFSVLSQALSRLSRGDYSGAVTSACSAVEVGADSLLEKNNIKKETDRMSYQEKVNSALKPYKDRLCGHIVDGVGDGDQKILGNSIAQTCSHAARALQVMRRKGGDVHGPKPSSPQSVYVAVRLATLLCAVFALCDEMK